MSINNQLQSYLMGALGNQGTYQQPSLDEFYRMLQNHKAKEAQSVQKAPAPPAEPKFNPVLLLCEA